MCSFRATAVVAFSRFIPQNVQIAQDSHAAVQDDRML